MKINKVPSQSLAADSSYTWNTAKTASATSLTPTSGPAGQEVVIAGSGFSPPVEVYVGAVAGAVTSVTDSAITFSVAEGPAGEQEVTVYAEFGRVSGALTFINTYGVSDVRPHEGSLAGTHAVYLWRLV